MGSIDYKTLRNLTVKSDYCIGELMLNGGKLEKINNHASKGKIDENNIVTSKQQNEDVRKAVSQCIFDKYQNKYANDGHQKAVSAAHDILMENNSASEILSRDEARYVVDMVEKAANGGQFGDAEYQKCKEDITLIRRIKREGLDNLTDGEKLRAKDLIWGLRSGWRLFNGSSAIVNPSRNYSRLNPANENRSNESPFTTPGGFATPGGFTTPGDFATPGGFATPGENTPTDTGTATGDHVVKNPIAGDNDLKTLAEKFGKETQLGGASDASGNCGKSFARFISAIFSRNGELEGLPSFGALKQLKSEFSAFMGDVVTNVTKKWIPGVTYQNMADKMLERLRSLPGDNPVFRLRESKYDVSGLAADDICKPIMDIVKDIFKKPEDTVSANPKKTADVDRTPTEKPVETPSEKPSEKKLYTFVGILGTKFETDDKSIFDSNSGNLQRHVGDLKKGMQARVNEILRDDSIRGVEDTYVAVINYVDDPKDFLELYFPDQKLESRLFKKLADKWFAKNPLVRKDAFVGLNFSKCYVKFRAALAEGLKRALAEPSVPKEDMPDNPLESEKFSGWFDKLLARLEKQEGKVMNSLLNPDLFLKGEVSESEKEENTRFENMMAKEIATTLVPLFSNPSGVIGR